MTFLDLAGEIRNQIYGELLPDISNRDPERFKKLRQDGQKTSTAFMATCHQVYEESVSMLYPPTAFDALTLRINSSGTVTCLGRMNKLVAAKPANFAVITRTKRLNLRIEVGISLQLAAVCDIQDAMFKFASLLKQGHQLEAVPVTIAIGSDPPSYNPYFEDFWDYSEDGYDFWGLHRGNAMVGRMREFRDIKPGDISRAHIAAFLTDPLRMIRGVKKSPKYRAFSLDFPGKTGRPWRDLSGQVYDLILGDAMVPDFPAFTRYFEGLRQVRRVIQCFGGKGKPNDSKEAFEKVAEDLSAARIRGDVSKFSEAHGNLLPIIDSSIARRSNYNKSRSYQMAETWEHWCRELIYLKIELQAALPSKDLDVSFRGYNIADAGLREWQTVGRKEAREAKRKRKADAQGRVEAAKKIKVADGGASSVVGNADGDSD